MPACTTAPNVLSSPKHAFHAQKGQQVACYLYHYSHLGGKAESGERARLDDRPHRPLQPQV